MFHVTPRSRTAFHLGGIVAAVMLATSGAQSAATRVAPVLGQAVEMSSAERMFADAPDGVDPMVTGPVSAAFRQQQEAAGCDQAAWPHIPLACYPR